PPYDDPHVIAGQGTVGLELMAQAGAQGVKVDDVIAPASGGGLIAGVGLAVRAAAPEARIFCAEPVGYDDHRRSLLAGSRVRNATTVNALCDALLAPTPGDMTWELNRATLNGGYAVTDGDVKRAVAAAFQTLKLVLEPSGAAALAAVLSGQLNARGRT